MTDVTFYNKTGALGQFEAQVVHGAVAGTARPSTSLSVMWVGTVTPTNAVNGDTYLNTGTGDEKVMVSGSFIPLNQATNTATYEAQANLDADVATKVNAGTGTSAGTAVYNAAKARAAATFSPLNLPNLIGWWAADQISGNVGDSVTTWADLSGNGLDMVAPQLNTPAAQSPAFTSPKIALDPYTGKRVVRFNGTSDVLQAWFQPLMSSATPLQVINGPISLFMAASARPWWTAGGTAQSGRTCCVATLSTTGFIWVQQNTSSGLYQWATRYLNPSNTGRDMGTGTPPSEGLLQTITAIWDGWQGAFPSVPSSGTWQQNNTGATYNVYITGGTYTDVSVQSALNGTQTGDVTSLGVATMVTLPPGCSIKITYSVAPTWTWVATGGAFGASLRVDGAEVFDSFSRQIAPNALTIGAQPPTHGADSNNYNGYAACDIGEIILLNKHATPSEIAAVENYLGRAA